MSKSKPTGNIELPIDEKEACKKIKRAVTGGRPTLEEHRRLGAEVEKCMVFSLLKMHLVEDDNELDEIYKEYKSGRMTSGEIKELACSKMNKFLEKFNKDIEKHRKTKINIIEF
jgi:tryptophanyl-tRNA synthetase